MPTVCFFFFSSRRRHTRWPRDWSSDVCSSDLLALVGLMAATVGLVTQLMPRTFTAAQKQQIVAWEMGKRWRAWAAGEIFPSTVPYQVPGSALGGPEGLGLTAHRIGIA